MSDNVASYHTVHEILDEAIDAYVAKEKARIESRGIITSKLEIKARLARAIGLGNGGDGSDAALKALYRLCSGETQISLERVILLCQQIQDYRLIEFAAFRCGLLTTPRAAIDADALDGEDIFLAVIELQKETSALVALLSAAYASRPSHNQMVAIEAAHKSAATAMERTTLLLVRFMGEMLKTGASKR